MCLLCLCVYVSMCVSVSEGVCTGIYTGAVDPGGLYVQVPATEDAGIQWQLPDGLSAGVYHIVYIHMQFPVMDFYSAQPETGTV